MMKMSRQRYERAIFLRDSALEMVERNGVLVRTQNAGLAREHASSRFSVFYADPETAACDEFHHLDVRTPEAGKVLSVIWKPGLAPEIVTFKRGQWEAYFVS